MCYKKPGPRCSSHALAQLSKAKLDFIEYENSINDHQSKNVQKEFLIRRKNIQKLEDEYYTTPAGLKELNESLEQEQDMIKKFQIQNRINLCLNKRQAQLKAIKAKDDYDNHDLESFEFKDYGNTNFNNNNEIDSEQLKNFFNDSVNWSEKLTTGEIDAVRWYTRHGYISIYDYQYKNTIGKESSAEFLETKINNLNNALKKYKREKPIIVYRGLNIYQGNKLSIHQAAETFKVGDEYAYESYSSTSLNSKTAERFAISNIVFAIKTRKAVPIMALSVHSAAEQELIIPANERFKVVGVQKNIFGNTTVQLEEI
jgi:hypothetical protein